MNTTTIASTARAGAQFVHTFLDSGVELGVDYLPHRQTAALCFRMLSGSADDPDELGGIASIVERTLSKGTAKYSGQGLADAFDALGAQWSGACGRQSTLIRVVCLPEFTLEVVDLVAEMLCKPTFPDEACDVALRLATEELKHMEDDPQDLLRADVQRLTLGPVYGRYPGGDAESLERITSALVRSHWQRMYHAGRLQVAAAGPLDAESLGQRINERFGGFGSPERGGRRPADFAFSPGRNHREKELKQEYLGITLPGAVKGEPDYATERVMIGVLSGGMSARLFTEVREKQGLVYWVGAWSEYPRGRGIVHVGASTTPERAEQTYNTLLRELERLGEDLTDAEVARSRNGLIAHAETEDDLTHARAGGLSDDLFHFSRPIGLTPKLDAVRAVTTEQVVAYARRFPRDRICVATVGPRAL